jgi:hypothetical protein
MRVWLRHGFLMNTVLLFLDWLEPKWLRNLTRPLV